MGANDHGSREAGQVVVVGAGQAAFSCCAQLRSLGHGGRISMIGEEPLAPYQRPPLSKAYLMGKSGMDDLLLRPGEFYAEHDIDVRTGVRVVEIDRPNARLCLSDGGWLGYDTLVLATGARPRTLPDDLTQGLRGIHYMRNVANADAIADGFATCRDLLIVGGGYIGLEAAAVAVSSGLRVTLVEAADRILQRVACAQTSAFFRRLHQDHGVRIVEGTAVTGLDGAAGRVCGAELSDGSAVKAELVIAGIGVLPNQELAANSGLACHDGIDVDDMCRTADPRIFAIGDCASFPFGNRRIRLESVGHAIDHGEAAARVIIGRRDPYVARPWFWSDQYDVKLQIAGLGIGHDHVVERVSNRPGSRSHWYFAGDTLIAVDAVNAPRAYMAGRRMIEAGTSPSRDAVADPDIDLKSLLT